MTGLIRYFGAFNRESLFVTQPHVIKEYLQTNGYKFHKLEAGRNIIEQVTGHGLLVADGDEHKVSTSIGFGKRLLMLQSVKGRVSILRSSSSSSRISYVVGRGEADLE